ncbi:MAG: carboxypeptidase-like regulatory domain-containing protein [Terracidiphilus sp.]|jgi:uncharacterized protein YdeI (BOF family)
MTIRQIAAIVLALSVCSAYAQEHAKGALAVVVTDPTGARVPNARIRAVEQATGMRFEALADANGEALIHVDQGTYELNVQAAGFQSWKQKEVEVKGEMRKTVTLQIGLPNWGPVVFVESEIPFEHPPLAAQIPLMPIEQFTVTAKRLHH